MNSIRKQLVTKLNQVYKNKLMDWNGDLDIFNPIEDTFRELFSKRYFILTFF